jgi:PAS domain S-box-containing protein
MNHKPKPSKSTAIVRDRRGSEPGKNAKNPPRKPETTIRSAQEWFRATLYSIGDAVITTDEGGKVLQMNPVAERLTGWSEAEARGKLVTRIFHIVNEETGRLAGDPVKRVLREGAVVGLANHTLLIARDGIERPIADSGAPIRDEKNRITGVVLVFRDQTDERAAQKALKESERKLRDIVRFLDEGYYCCSLDGLLLEHNLAFNRILGFGLDRDLKGTRLTDFWQNPDERQEYVRELAARGAVTNYLISAKTVDGGKMVVMANSHLVRDENNKPVRIEGTFTDFSDRRRLEEKVDHLNLVLKSIRNVNQLITKEQDRGRLIKGACDSLIENRGYYIAWVVLLGENGAPWLTAEAGLGGDFSLLLERFNRGELPRCVRGAMAKDGVFTIDEVSSECADCPLSGKYGGRGAISSRLEFGGKVHGFLTVALASHLVADKEERTLFHEAANDIAFALGGIEVEESRRKAEEALQESVQKFRNVFNNSSLGMSITSIDGSVHVNRALSEMLGYTMEELSHLRWQDLTHPDDIEWTQKHLEQLHSGEKKTVRFIKRYVKKDGALVWGDLNTVLQQDVNRQPLYYISAVMDITERKRAEEEVRKLNEELEQRVRDRTADLEAANKELEAFAYSVSHDLRAPLRAIDGYVRILTEDFEPHLGAEGKRVCGVIGESARNMGKLIDDLLSFSRLSRAEIQPSSIDMGTLAHSVYHELTTAESRERIDFQVGSLPGAIGDPTLIRQVWMNLISNAIKFSARKERAAIAVAAELRGTQAVYSVKDNGAGFDMQYRDKLFGVFQRLHSPREFEGIGVGLAIVQRIIHRHGGRVWAEGAVDKGATFYFTLPVKETDHGGC